MDFKFCSEVCHEIKNTVYMIKNAFNPNPLGPFCSLTSCGLIPFFGSWVSFRVRNNFQTLRARQCKIISRVRVLLCIHSTVHGWLFFTIGFAETYYTISLAVGVQFIYTVYIYIIRFAFPLAFQHHIPTCSSAKTPEATAKRIRWFS